MNGGGREERRGRETTRTPRVPAMMERGGERGGGTQCRRHTVVSRGGPWRGVVTAEPTDRGGPPRKNQEFNHEWPRNQRRAVTSSEPGHPLPPGALPTTAPPLVSYINILFTSLRAAITRCASLYYLAGRRRTNGERGGRSEEERRSGIRMAAASRASHCSHYSATRREIDDDPMPKRKKERERGGECSGIESRGGSS